ncbi:Flp family type IVb pilin [Paeniglutamicibacter sp. ABSL32-1]|jgi:pilus assembly protein Flp/PilA|uniref:Flp family type IVb pilin n=1 Tax=Paeniglutamicibacter quisquiliarum TaxID=2849498 RepID=UPI001C2D5867|nr:Flp family type IVb pilin [Paeniglutamicibacter quisquiliarum]MBV1780038.1 Flp family type IVb pilin [Paeniglutamicibacter quisquiliarum]
MLSIYATLQTLGFRIKNRFQRDETGATAVEYGIMVGVIAVAIIATLMLLGPQLNALFLKVSAALPAVGA